MYFELLVFAFVVSSPALTGVVKDNNSCSASDFSCGNGECVSLDQFCDGRTDCDNGNDEALCMPEANRDFIALRRKKRQSTCRKEHWRCRDGTCISFDGMCDGKVDCPDKSDETHALCRNTTCQPNWFRCTYGACVDGSAPCNGSPECADESDELLPRCRNEASEVRGQFMCGDGTSIPAANHCDGNPDCPDGSDEIVRACAGKTCASYLFQCAYGACVDRGSDCDGKIDCADQSDEAPELCNKLGPIVPTITRTTTTAKPKPTVVTSTPPKTGDCKLPDYPKHGKYSVINAPGSKPGDYLEAAQLNISCSTGYRPVGESLVFCYQGNWVQKMPKCVRHCKLKKHESVDYRCVIKDGSAVGTRDCKEYEPVGVVVKPTCRNLYYAASAFTKMECIEDGSWSSTSICRPECGRVTPVGEQLVIGGRAAERGELPWHAGIYRKTTTPYEQICGGTLISNTVVISAAHCFWEDQLMPASNYAVAVGKIYRPWNNPRDPDAQKSDVTDIKIPNRFLGSEANYQDDIAILLLATAFVYKSYVRPVCIELDTTFDSLQLKAGNLGKVAGWGIEAENGNASQILRVVDLPSVDVTTCIKAAPVSFRAYITSDKICAGYQNGTALCKGDSGGGLVFPATDKNVERFYLRGIVSTAPNNDNLCNAYSLTTFTQIVKHDDFIQEYI